MRRLGVAEIRSLENINDIADQFFLFTTILLQVNTTKMVSFMADIPDHVDKPFAPVIIMEQRGVKAAAIEVNGVTPDAINRLTGGEIVMCILDARVQTFHVGVNQVKKP